MAVLLQVCPSSDGGLHANLVCPVSVPDMPEQTLPDIQSAERARQFLRNVSQGQIKQPFFLGLGFHKPHVPLKFDKHFLGELLNTLSNSLSDMGLHSNNHANMRV